MFKKLFSTPQVTQPKKQQPQSSYEVAVIEEIHDSFDRASNEALDAAKKIIADNEISESKEAHVEMLLKAGFHNAKQVAETNELRHKRIVANQRAEKVMYFQQKYPQYKFIFADQVDAICKKYNLVCGDIDRYMGEVPVKNLKEIINFKIHEDDFVYNVGASNYNIGYGRYAEERSLSILVESAYLKTEKEYEEMKEQNDKWVKENWNENKVHGVYDQTPYVWKSDIKKQICAPIKEMKVNDWEKIENNKIVAVPDPIVLHIVKGGFLIVSKWGIEGQDVSLTNEVMN